MRVKQVWEYVPLPAKFKLVWDRLTFSRLTTIYIIFSLLHCMIQAALQISAFVINADAAKFLYDIAAQGNATGGFAVPAVGSNDIRLCNDVPVDALDISECQVIWNGTAKTNWIGSASAPVASDSAAPAADTSAPDANGPKAPNNFGAAGIPFATAFPDPTFSASLTTPTASSTRSLFTIVVLPTVSVKPSTPPPAPTSDLSRLFNDPFGLHEKRDTRIRVSEVDGDVTVTLNGNGYNDVTAHLSRSCLWSLNWPVNVLDNTKREDVVFIAFQFWVLGMSVVALLNESIPHIFASLLTHVLATAWSAFQIANTAHFKSTFNRMITHGACNGVPLLPDYWESRAKLEFPLMALNIVGLLISSFLTWRLVKLFGWQTFKRVGASLSINRIYKLVLVFSILLQLGFFFTGAAVGIWLDNLINGVASQVAWFIPLYKATSVVTLALLIPWLWTGWYSVRQEKRAGMFVFLVFSLLYMGGWSVMFLSTTFRWMFVTWRFFSLMAVASTSLTLISFVLGVICRYNFGKGLQRYLNAQEPLPGDDFAPVTGRSDVEKVDFPSNEKPVPTFSVTFGSGDEVPPPSQMFAGRLGPRFYNASAEPFETPRNSPPTTTAPSEISDARPRSPVGSIASYYSYSPTESSMSRSEQGHNGKRWVIE